MFEIDDMTLCNAMLYRIAETALLGEPLGFLESAIASPLACPASSPGPPPVESIALAEGTPKAHMCATEKGCSKVLHAYGYKRLERLSTRPRTAAKSLRKRHEGPSKGMARVLSEFEAFSLLDSHSCPLFLHLCASSALSNI